MKFSQVLATAAIAAFASVTHAAPVGYTAWDVSGSDILVRMDLATGVGTTIGTGIGFNDVDGLAFDGSGNLWGVNDSTNQLLRIDITTGIGTVVGSSFGSGYNDMGLAFAPDGTLYMSSENGSGVGRLYTVDTVTGADTLIGNTGGVRLRSLGFAGGTLYGWSNIDTLVTVNTSTGAVTTIGDFDFPSFTSGQDGMDADPATGILWAIAEIENRTYTLSTATGAATIFATSLLCDGAACIDRGGFNGLAIQPVPEPGTWAMLGAGLLGVGLSVRRAGRR
jgi:hypothetical protein